MNIACPDRAGTKRSHINGAIYVWLGYRVEECNVKPLGELVQRLLVQARQAGDVTALRAQVAELSAHPETDPETDAVLVEAQQYLDSLTQTPPAPTENPQP